MPKVAIVGAGVIGLLCAYELRRRGAEVIVVDRAQPGRACSLANAGWIVPSLSAPLPSPGLMVKSIKWLLRRNSPLFIKPSSVPAMLGWLGQFRRHCNRTDYEAGFRAVAALNRSTMSLYDRLEQEGLSFEMAKAGLLFVFRSEPELRHVRDDLALMEQYGYSPPEEFPANQLRELEPGLSRDLSGGIRVHEERHVRPEALCAALIARLQEHRVEIMECVDVGSVAREGDRVTAITGSSHAAIEADAFVIAAGAWSGRVAAEFGYGLPVQAGKGYSITVANPAVRLTHALYLGEAKIGCTPFDGALRIAGTMELSGINLSLDRKRVAALESAVRGYLPRALEGGTRTEWVGMRPITPDGLPIIGRLPSCSNVYVATGHALLGVTLAPSTGAAIADLILGNRSDVDLKPFDPARF